MEVVKYLLGFILMLVVYGVPVVVVYGLVRVVFSRLTAAQAAVASTHTVQEGAWLIAALRRSVMTPVLWGETVVVVASIAWLVLRPGRGPVLALLVYQAVGLLFANLPPLLSNPWGSTMHKAAVTALLIRLVIGWLLVRALREAKPAVGQSPRAMTE